MQRDPLQDMPMIAELARDALRELHSERFVLEYDDVVSFLDIEHKKEDERQVRELLKQKQGRRHNLFPELRSLLDTIAETK